MDLPVDEVILEFVGVTIDQVAWDATWTFTPGASAAFVSLVTGDPTLNDVPTAWGTGSAAYGDGDLGTPGGANLTTLVAEDFSVWPPTALTVDDPQADGQTWGVCTDPADMPASTFSLAVGDYACIDSGVVNGGMIDESLVSGSLDATGLSVVWLAYDSNFQFFSARNSEGRVELTTDGGTTSQNIVT